jgi:hypothetical protein
MILISIIIFFLNQLSFKKDANVYVQMFGKRYSTNKINLDTSRTNKDKFERGNTDVFIVQALDVGDLKQLKIGHDNKGFGAGWHLKEVFVECNNKKFIFPCNKWLDKKEDDGKIERDLFCTDVKASLPLNNSDEIDYTINVVTSDISDAGTGKLILNYCDTSCLSLNENRLALLPLSIKFINVYI